MKKFTLLTFIFLLAACGAQVERKATPEPVQQLEVQPEEPNAPIQSATAEFQSAEYTDRQFDLLATNLLEIDFRNWSPVLAQMLDNRPSALSTFADSDYFKLFVEQFSREGAPALDQNLREISRNKEVLAQWFAQHPLKLGKPERRSLDAAAAAGLGYVQQIRAAIPGLHLHPLLSKELDNELKERHDRLRASVGRALKKINASKTLTGVLSELNKWLKAEDFESDLDKDTKKTIANAVRLGAAIDRIQNSQTALATLIDIWFFLTPEERKASIGGVNPSLYDYLAGKSENDLRCIQDGSCESIVDNAVKSFFVLPKINAFGVQKLKDTLNEKSKAVAMEQLLAAAVKIIPDLPSAIQKIIAQKTDAKLSPLVQLQKKTDTDLAGRWRAYERRQNSPEGLMLSWSPARISWRKGTQSLEWAWTPADGPTYAPNLGLVANAARTMPERPWTTAALLGGVQQVAAPAPANDGTFDVLANALELQREVKLIRLLTAEHATSFDGAVGSLTAQDLFTEFQHQSLQAKIFPKDAVIGLTLLKMKKILKALNARGGPLFFITTTEKIRWGDEFKVDGPEVSVTAGLVDVGPEGRGNKVSAFATAQMLIAVADFIDYTKNIERVESTLLAQRDADGMTPIELLRDARATLRLLALTLANTLSNRLLNSKRLVVAECTIGQRCEGPTRARDQWTAMRALGRAAKVTGIDVYNWSARDLYVAMNREFWNTKTNFWGPGAPDPLTLSEALLALRSVAPSLPLTTLRHASQVDRLWTQWLRRLTKPTH